MIMPMSASAHTAAKDAAAPSSAGGGVRALLGRQLHIVGRLADKALETACRIWKAATDNTSARGARVSLDWLAAVHPKVSRALRLAVLLHARLMAELRGPGPNAAPAGDTAAPAADPPAPEDPRAEVLRMFAEEHERTRRLMQAIASGTFDPDAWEEQDDLYDRDDLEDEYDDLDRPERDSPDRLDSLGREPADPLRRYVMTRPVDELIAEIARDLGLAPQWLREVEQQWEQAQRQADLPPEGGVPAEGRGGGLHPPALPPPSSASPTLPPEGEDPSDPPWIARELGAYGASPQGRG